MEYIDLFQNVGDSLATINNNILELDGLLCNLNAQAEIWNRAYTYFIANSSHWTEPTNLISFLSGKWEGFTNLIYSFSGLWQGNVTFIYPHPFVEGGINLNDIKNFVDGNVYLSAYPENQKITFFYFIQNYAAIPTQSNNIFQKAVSSICYRKINNQWVETDCFKNKICPINSCDSPYKFLNLDDSYDCFNCVERFYYLIDV